MEKRLNGKVAVITGAGTGIGRAIALNFAREGANLAISGRTAATLEEVAGLARQTGSAVLALVADVTNEAQVEELMRQTVHRFGRLDILVNNAGVSGKRGLITEIGLADWEAVMDTNVTGAFLCGKAAARYMMPQKSGNIINISSGSVNPKQSRLRSLPYMVSKYALEGVNFGLSIQLKPYGICVNALRPGVTDTLFHRDSPPEWHQNMRQPEEIAPLALYLAQQTVETMTGQSIDLKDWLAEQDGR